MPIIHNIKKYITWKKKLWPIAYAYYLLCPTLVSYVDIGGAVLSELPLRDIFGVFYNCLSFMISQVYMSAQNMPKKSLHGKCHLYGYEILAFDRQVASLSPTDSVWSL